MAARDTVKEGLFPSTYSTKKMKINFEDAKYQVPAGPKSPASLSEYETTEWTVYIKNGNGKSYVRSRQTTDSVYLKGDELSIRLSPLNYEAEGTKARVESGGRVVLDGYEDIIIIGSDFMDSLHSYKGSDGIIDAGSGKDKVISDATQVKLGAGNDRYEAYSEGINLISAWGERGNDKMDGNKLSNLLMGGEGNDNIKGYDGNDTLNGGTGNDQIAGGSGDDYIKAGRGDDIIKLGSGNDILDLSRGNDIVKDFKVKEDVVVIDEEFFGQQLQFTDKKKGCYITNGEDVNTFFKGVSSDLLAAVVDLN